MSVNPADRTTQRLRGTFREVQQVATQMRHAMTPAEVLLWDALEDRRLAGLRFRAQHPVGQFVLDFYCPARKLAIELDGAGHDAERDNARTERLYSYGYRVVRFANAQVLDNLPSVLETIRRAAEEGLPAPITGSSEGENPLPPPIIGGLGGPLMKRRGPAGELDRLTEQ